MVFRPRPTSPLLELAGVIPPCDGSGWTLAQQAAMAEELADMRRRLDTLPVIEQSKGLLMARFGIDSDTAFAVLRRWSSHTNLNLRDISRMLVEAAAEPGVGGGSALADLIDRLQDNQAGHRDQPDQPTRCLTSAQRG